MATAVLDSISECGLDKNRCVAIMRQLQCKNHSVEIHGQDMRREAPAYLGREFRHYDSHCLNIVTVCMSIIEMMFMQMMSLSLLFRFSINNQT